MTVYRGSCHCGALGFEFRTGLPPASWFVRTCECGFCVKHAGLYTSDPAGSLLFTHQDATKVSKYRFGHQTADFIFCGGCGGYLGACMEADGRASFVLNIRALDPAPQGVADPKTMSYEDESAGERISRRSKRWTPVRT